MEVKEKAKKLVDMFYPFTLYTDATLNGKRDAFNRAKQCALIAIDFAIKAIEDCSVVAGYPLDEYKQIKDELLKL